MHQAFFPRVREGWRSQKIKSAVVLFSPPFYHMRAHTNKHTHTHLFSPFHLSLFHPSRDLSIHLFTLSIYWADVFVLITLLFADWLGCLAWAEEAVSEQRQRQSGTRLYARVIHIILPLSGASFVELLSENVEIKTQPHCVVQNASDNK